MLPHACKSVQEQLSKKEREALATVYKLARGVAASFDNQGLCRKRGHRRFWTFPAANRVSYSAQTWRRGGWTSPASLLSCNSTHLEKSLSEIFFKTHTE